MNRRRLLLALASVATAIPAALRAQQKATPVIGFPTRFDARLAYLPE
jgi:hypothetical protein